MKVECAHDELVDIDSLVPNPRNTNKHSDRQLELLAKILKFQGWRSPITISNRSGFMVAGHGSWAAAKINGWKQVPIDRQDFENEAAEYAHLEADNNIAKLAEHDEARMMEQLMEIDPDFDLDLFGIPDLKIDVSEIEMPDLKEGNNDFQQMTFTLHNDQVVEVNNAIEKAKGMGHFDGEVNENSNGNALARISEWFVNGQS